MLYNSSNELIPELTKDIQKTIKLLELLFDKCDDMVQKRIVLQRKPGPVEIYIIYVDGLTDNEMIERTVIRPLLWEWKYTEKEDFFEQVFLEQIETVDVVEDDNLDNIIRCMLRGDTAIFVDGYAKGLVVSSKKLPVRSVGETESEAVMRGPKDSFNESIRTSTALIRRRIRDPKLKVEQFVVGQRSKTDYAVIYMEDLAKPGEVQAVKERLKAFEVDGIFDSGMMEHLMDPTWYSPFPLIQSTERPDKVASAILEGRVAVVFDNSPEVLLMPATLNTFFQASDDYYNRWSVASFARILRYMAALLAIGLPGFYVALTGFHTQLLPTDLVLAIATARSAVTFPVVVEVLIMELEFELLREAGIRLPGQMGNTIGIVGGLIVGQAAVDAGIVSTIVVIVVALTAIASFAIPNEVFASGVRLLKFFLILASAFFGLYGFLLGMLVIGIHLSGLVSFGVPYLMPLVAGTVNQDNDQKDFLVRLPGFMMKKRPIFTRPSERQRLRRSTKK